MVTKKKMTVPIFDYRLTILTICINLREMQMTA